MSKKYERLYAATPHALGDPFPEVVAQIAELAVPSTVLDLGAGQGRDALFIARLGHRVVAVDAAPSGLAQLADQAKADGLAIETVCADLTGYTPADTFDVVLADRTLHMLAEAPRLALARRMATWAKPDGWVLIVDERANIPGLKACFPAADFAVQWAQKGFLFLRRKTSD